MSLKIFKEVYGVNPGIESNTLEFKKTTGEADKVTYDIS